MYCTKSYYCRHSEYIQKTPGVQKTVGLELILWDNVNDLHPELSRLSIQAPETKETWS